MNNLTRAMAYLEKLPSAVSGSGGHNATLRAACECVRFGLSDSETWEAMSWYNLNRCQPVWREHELRHKINDAQKMSGPTRARQSSQRQARAFVPPVITAKRKPKPVIQQGHEAEELFWAAVWRERGLPDPATVSLADFRAAIKTTDRMSQ